MKKSVTARTWAILVAAGTLTAGVIGVVANLQNVAQFSCLFHRFGYCSKLTPSSDNGSTDPVAPQPTPVQPASDAGNGNRKAPILTPQVGVVTTPADWGGDCLQFAFDKLPGDFAVGEIKLNILSTTGPVEAPNAQSAEILTYSVDGQIPVKVLTDDNPGPIAISVRRQATRANDSFYVKYCPTWDRAGVEGTLSTSVDFFTPSGSKITTLKYVTGKKAIQFKIVRPRNLIIALDVPSKSQTSK